MAGREEVALFRDDVEGKGGAGGIAAEAQERALLGAGQDVREERSV